MLLEKQSLSYSVIFEKNEKFAVVNHVTKD